MLKLQTHLKRELAERMHEPAKSRMIHREKEKQAKAGGLFQEVVSRRSAASLQPALSALCQEKLTENQNKRRQKCRRLGREKMGNGKLKKRIGLLSFARSEQVGC